MGTYHFEKLSLRLSGYFSVCDRVEVMTALPRPRTLKYCTCTRYMLSVCSIHSSREAESRAFPFGERVTASGLVALALRLLGPHHHLRVRLELCAATQVNHKNNFINSSMLSYHAFLEVRLAVNGSKLVFRWYQ